MANQEQLKILKQGSKVWNKWREDNWQAEIDLLRADLKGANLTEANLTKAKLRGADLSMANLSEANLSRANLNETDLSKASLIETDFSEASLIEADLHEAIIYSADFWKANLIGANLHGANLSRADLREAYLHAAIFLQANLNGANLDGAYLYATIFADIDFSNSSGLASARHDGASTLGTHTLMRSKGKIPDAFLRGCGLSDWEIESAKLYDPNLTNQELDEILYRVHYKRAHQLIQISPLFISHSHADSNFVDRMENSLNEKGIRFWRDIHHATAGKLEKQIDRAINQNPTVLVVLSKNSIHSDWVQHEVRKARELEKDIGRDVLCPVALDDSWKNSSWPQRIMEQVMEYNILDFSEWKDDEKFKRMFVRLIDGLNLYYKKEAAS